MFPNIAPEDRFSLCATDRFAHDGIVLVGSGDDFELATVDHQPGPTAAEPAHAGGLELFFERIETAERGFDVVGQFSAGRATSVRAHEFPEHGMIGMAAAVVA